MSIISFIFQKYFIPPHTLGAMVTPQVYVLVECEGQGPGFKSPEGSFTHI